MLIALALRNIWRVPRRTICTLLAVSFTTAVLVFFQSLQFSTYATTINASTSIFQGHLQVQDQNYAEKPQIRNSINDSENILMAIEKIPGIDSITSRAMAFALASSAERTYGIQVVGVETEQEKKLSSIPGTIMVGSYLNSTAENTAVIGEALARNLKITVGGELTLLGQSYDGSLAASVVKIVGIFRSGSVDIDRGLIEIPLQQFQEIFSMGNKIHTIVIKSANIREVAALQKDIKIALSHIQNSTQPVRILRWDELMPGLKESIDLDYASSWLFFSSLILIVCFTILNTFLMSVLERTREFGIMLAIGCTPMRISILICIESLLLTGMGILFGASIGALIVLYFIQYGFHIPGSEEIMQMWNISMAIYPQITLQSITISPAIIFIVAFLSSLYPAIRIWKLEPVTAIRST